MQNHIPGGGHNVPSGLPVHPHQHQNPHQHQHQRRDHYGYQQHQAPSPMHHNFYHQFHHQQYYGHPQHQQPFRWQPPYPQQHYAPPPHLQQPYPQRSPVVVSSQPHGQPITPVTRHQNPLPPPQQHIPSPAPTSTQTHQHVSAASPSPVPNTASRLEQRSIETPETAELAPPARRPSTAQNPLSLPPEHKQPFWPKLPWYSVPEDSSTFPARANPRRRRRRNNPVPDAAVSLPTKQEGTQDETPMSESQAPSAEDLPSETSTIAAPSELETPATSQAPSESDFAQASTPATTAQTLVPSPKPTPTQQHLRRDTRTAIAVPVIPGLPKHKESPSPVVLKQEQGDDAAVSIEKQPEAQAEPATPSTPPPKPKSWADLVRRNAKPDSLLGLTNGEPAINGFFVPKSASLSDALRQYSVRNGHDISFLEPRGLANTGNMCYMNSILQVLVFCAPFYDFLDQVRQRTVHSMKSETPLLDAMIMFMREFKVLASADSVGSLRASLKQEQLEQYGEPITPEYVYDVIRNLPRFAGMRRGHQQDAEEFLGFLLEGLHDECVKVIQGRPDESPQENGVTSPTSADGWLEVGPKQKASVTRTAGQHDAASPITKIFGGHLRSELRIPGQKDSVTLEPYKPLQLDIGAAHVTNIVEALKGLTRTEALTGDFGGRGNTAKKQVFIDTLPPVLILHLKRFQYDSSFSGTQKIWKKVGYPLELEIPKEVFPLAKRGGLAVRGGLPKYRLTSVVYHHGTSAAGGHYTVDVLREDSREWVRMDDTFIRRIRAEEVAEGGAEEDPKILARALEQHRADSDLQKQQQQQRNMYQGLDEAEHESDEEQPWSEVNGNHHASGHTKKWSGTALSTMTNGTSTPSSASGKKTPTPARKEGARDNKVAYILLYERMRE